MTDEGLYGPERPGDSGFNATLDDGRIMLTWSPPGPGEPRRQTALLTVRGKDHSLTADQLRALARAATRAADAIEGG